MAIWSLTQERVEKLLKQKGDKEVEIDTLIKISPKELWTRDLDDFIAEWRFQLEDEAKRAKKIRGLGRRASAKLNIGGAKAPVSKKRKADDSSGGEESDFAIAKMKKPAAKKEPKPSDMFSYLASKSEKPAPKLTSHPLVNGIEQKPVAPPPAAMIIDGAADVVSEVKEKSNIPAFFKKAKAAAESRAKPTRKGHIISDDSDDDVVAEIAKEAKKTEEPVVTRQPRAAARKPVKYAGSDDSEQEMDDDMLGDVSKLVKGIGLGSDNTASNGRTLFSASASRPGSSHGPKFISKPATKSVVDLSDDETDYTKLIPRDSPQKPAARTANDTVLSDDQDESMELPKPKPVSNVAKPVAKRTAKAAAPPKPMKRTVQKAAPVTAKAPPKKAALSPAAKAYAAGRAAKQQAAKLIPEGKAVESESDNDVDAIANDLLSDGPMSEEDEVVMKPRAAASRPARRAVAQNKKPTYVVDDDSEEESDVSEADSGSGGFSDSE